MSDPYAAALSGAAGRSLQLDQILGALLRQAPDIEAAAVVSFDGLPMASALPAGMDEDRVAAMSAALLSLGERAAQGLGRGDLSQVYVEGDNGTVFLVSADDEAVLVAVGRVGAKVGLMLFEVKQAAGAVGTSLRIDVEPLPALVNVAPEPQQVQTQQVQPQQVQPVPVQPQQVQPVPVQHAAGADPTCSGAARTDAPARLGADSLVRRPVPAPHPGPARRSSASSCGIRRQLLVLTGHSLPPSPLLSSKDRDLT